ncbi:putative nucleic acid-binding protein [Catenuloplanes nepalensis]|uniref:Ribonuclease VapC n=1 Tax=Catenuloplanes nepalensis TaxID=587533 RepID=A0ABT9N7D1_9ACTN|nr:type II toxin-antitoxin system VapC family toxin [Catenuloplanes nepalensis]MDP9799610.1 putative nucleic acid-binding protein [Catenuloplanes nepalensis]
MIVLDSNVVSEFMRPAPDPLVVAWLRSNSSEGLHTTTITVAEIRYSIACLPQGRRKDDLQQAADEIFAAFPAQILPFDLAAANAYAEITANRKRLGRTISASDAQIAAICNSRPATLATRNIKDFTDTGIALLDPWQP